MDCADEDVISYGTPLATEEEEDEAPRKKPVPIDQQEVRDERGLRRFHGAFTGGFSAGYFNTVGTKEGWTPSTFSSSRVERAGKQSQRPEDFMDTEDLGVFGIAPRAIQVNKEFAEEEKGASKGARKRQFVFNQGPIPGLPPLKDLIVPSSDSAGVKLLRRMGWKPGQGIGPRVRTKKKRKAIAASEIKEPEAPGVKVYGCFLPKDVSLEEDSDDEELLRGITFAPDDVEVMSYKAKDDFHGIGYTGLDRNPILATFRSGKNAIAPPPVRDKKKRLAITGEAFGVGVYEEDDENIYGVDDMTQYDFELGASASKKKDNEKVSKGDGRKGVGKLNEILEGFHLSSKSSIGRKKRYPPPQLPKSFLPLRRRSDVVASETTKHEISVLDRHRMTATERAEIVGTEKQKGSVFDLLRPEDKERLMAITNKSPQATASTSLSTVKAPPAPLATPSSSLFTSRDRRGPRSGFQPFASDEDKQKRYDLYLKFKDENKEDSIFQKFQPSVMTEWEKQREMEEFRLAAAIYRPLAHGMALRFVTAKQSDIDMEMKTALAAKTAKAAESAIDEVKVAATVVIDYGKKTRTRLEWHPDRLLCRRFNVPDPYPESTVVGLLKAKREKFSVFNMFKGLDSNATVGDDLLAIELPKEPEEPSTSIIKDSAESSSTTPAAKGNRPNLFANLDDIETMPDRMKEKLSSSQLEDNLNEESSSKKDNEPSKPPLDLFKAIFQNTDSEEESSSSSSSEHEDETTKNTDDQTHQMQKTATVPAVKAISVADAISNHSATMRAYAPSARASTTSGLFSNLDFDTLEVKTPAGEGVSIPTDIGQKRLASVAIRAPSTDPVESNYGPALPPRLKQTTDIAATTSNVDVDRKRRDKKSHKSKHKHKHKKSKSKHGKHRRHRHTSDSESSSDSETADVDLNRIIKTRIKKCKVSLLE